MYSLMNDYSEGAHPRILQAMLDTNLEQTAGYGQDPFCHEAADLLRARIGRSEVDIHFIPGGTQTNMIAISAFLRPHEAAVSAVTGHIELHEAGAIEATGHKVVTAPGKEGKLRPEDVQAVVDFHLDEHMVKPRLVYISNATELGSIYTKQELSALSRFCREHNLLLYMDGARLGSALTAPGNDLTLADLADLTDAFYVGGTKNGALIGEALVICSDQLKEDFRFHIKQKGALLAKGRLLGLQFRELFRDDLFFQLADHANRLAAKIQEALRALGCRFLLDSPTNQIFPVFPNWLIAELQKDYAFLIWQKVDADHSVVRLVTSWATPEEVAERFVARCAELLRNH